MIRKTGYSILIICLFALIGFAQGENTDKPGPRPTPKLTKPVSPKLTVDKTTPSTKNNKKPKSATIKKSNKNIAPDTSTELNIYVNQGGVKIFIDEVEYNGENGESPLIVNSLSPSTHTIRVEKSGYQTENRTIKLSARKKSSLQFNLIASTGLLDILVIPSDAAIEVNNQTFTGQVTDLALSVGNYSFTVSKKGFKSVTYSITIENGTKTSQIVVLQPLKPNE